MVNVRGFVAVGGTGLLESGVNRRAVMIPHRSTITNKQAPNESCQLDHGAR